MRNLKGKYMRNRNGYNSFIAISGYLVFSI